MRQALLLALLVASTPAIAADQKAATPAQPGADKEKLICRREVPVGSLIASRKVCLTKAQWEQRAIDGNEEARKMVYDNQGRPTGN